jgi:hypothetical protein
MFPTKREHLMSGLKIDELDRPLWGADAIGEIIGKTKGQTFPLLNKGLLDADKVGGTWVSTARRLLNQFAGRRAAQEKIPPVSYRFRAGTGSGNHDASVGAEDCHGGAASTETGAPP